MIIDFETFVGESKHGSSELGTVLATLNGENYVVPASLSTANGCIAAGGFVGTVKASGKTYQAKVIASSSAERIACFERGKEIGGALTESDIKIDINLINPKASMHVGINNMVTEELFKNYFTADWYLWRKQIFAYQLKEQAGKPMFHSWRNFALGIHQRGTDGEAWKLETVVSRDSVIARSDFIGMVSELLCFEYATPEDTIPMSVGWYPAPAATR